MLNQNRTNTAYAPNFGRYGDFPAAVLTIAVLLMAGCATGTPPGQPVQVTAPSSGSAQAPMGASDEEATAGLESGRGVESDRGADSTSPGGSAVAPGSAGNSEGTASSEGGVSRACESDADCVPSGCCHPDSCVPASQAPSCDDVMCTRECRANTLDCGGQCLCQEGQCVAQFARPLRLER